MHNQPRSIRIIASLFLHEVPSGGEAAQHHHRFATDVNVEYVPVYFAPFGEQQPCIRERDETKVTEDWIARWPWRENDTATMFPAVCKYAQGGEY